MAASKLFSIKRPKTGPKPERKNLEKENAMKIPDFRAECGKSVNQGLDRVFS